MMSSDLVIFDDLISAGEVPPDPEKLREAIAALRLPEITKRGEYVNRFGEKVTWEASEDGKYVAVHTWPEKKS